MTNQINTINFEFANMPFRAIMKGDQPWFVATEIGKILGLKGNGVHITKCLDDDEKGVIISNTLGGNQRQICVSESGLWALVFRSRSPIAKKFRKWVTSEVIPSIRRQGFYVNPLHDDFVSIWEAAKRISRHYKTIWNRVHRHGLEIRDGETGKVIRFSCLIEHLKEHPIQKPARMPQGIIDIRHLSNELQAAIEGVIDSVAAHNVEAPCQT
jgi:prophage antirepressor-like protein